MTLHGDHLVNHIRHPGLRSNNVLHVIGVCSNTSRYQSRYRIAREWMKHMESTPDVRLHVVEAAFGDREFEITDAKNPHHLQIRIQSEIWIKENMINLAVKNLLPRDWKYMAWVDMDVFFANPRWAQETMHQLQHFDLVQPWSDCMDLGANGNVLSHWHSFGRQHLLKIQKQENRKQPYEYAHCGYAWACTRKFWENVGGLIDFAILGSADWHMAWASIGKVGITLDGYCESYRRRCEDWGRRALKVTCEGVGAVMGRIEHSFHGKKSARGYETRGLIFSRHKYDPDTDLYYDSQGVLCLLGKPAMEQDIRAYNRARIEDSIEES